MAEVQKLVLEGTLDTCPVCGYADGFHVSFNVAMGERQIILICPQCHSRFDPDWTI